ncbi:MAG: LemA family protein [Flavobacterium sp.]
MIFVFIAVWAMNLYNNLVRLRNNRQKVFADIDVQLRQRHDLVPQLVETVKGYAGHERELLLKITEARSGAVSATTIDDKIKAEEQLSKVLQGLNVRAEAYPDLKANQNFLRLQEQLNEIENKLADIRRLFNAATTEYNTAVESFPSNLVANNFDFKREVMFDIGTQEVRKQIEEVPVVKF